MEDKNRLQIRHLSAEEEQYHTRVCSIGYRILKDVHELEAAASFVSKLTREMRKSRNILVVAYGDLPGKWVDRNRHRFYQVDREDLEQLAALGLLDAPDHYDYESGTPFAKYAEHRIWNAVTNSPDVQFLVSRYTYSILRRVRAAHDALLRQHNRKPTVEEIARESGLSIGQVNNVINLDLSSESSVDPDLVLELIEDPRPLPDDIDFDSSDNSIVNGVKSWYAFLESCALRDREIKVFLLTSFSTMTDDDSIRKADSEIAESLDITPNNLRQIRRRAKRKVIKTLIEKSKVLSRHESARDVLRHLYDWEDTDSYKLEPDLFQIALQLRIAAAEPHALTFYCSLPSEQRERIVAHVRQRQTHLSERALRRWFTAIQESPSLPIHYRRSDKSTLLAPFAKEVAKDPHLISALLECWCELQSKLCEAVCLFVDNHTKETQGKPRGGVKCTISDVPLSHYEKDDGSNTHESEQEAANLQRFRAIRLDDNFRQQYPSFEEADIRIMALYLPILNQTVERIRREALEKLVREFGPAVSRLGF